MGGGLLGVAIGDVAGKGVPAALYAAFASGTMRARAFERRVPADLMQRVNRTLRRRGIEGLFCTLAYALFDFQDRSLRLANSGLPYPLHYRAADGAGGADRRLGAAPRHLRRRRPTTRSPWSSRKGDVVVFYTDGLVEARQGREEYGPDRLLQGLEAHAALAAPELGERLLAELEGFLGDDSPADDVTLIVVKVL